MHEKLKTYYRCWKVLDDLEQSAYKELVNLWKDSKADNLDVRDQTNLLLGISRAKTLVNLTCALDCGINAYDLDEKDFEDE